MELPNGAWVVVADGERRLLLENRGDDELMDLRVREHEESPNPPNTELGEDRPGRFYGSGGRREAVQETDWKRLDKRRFAAELAERINAAAQAGTLPPWVLMADARTLGEVRGHLRDAARARLLADAAADHAHEAVPAIEAAVKRL